MDLLGHIDANAPARLTDKANLDEGEMWPAYFALEELTAAVEARITALVEKPVS